VKTLIHTIPTLRNGGAETVLSRLIEEFSGNDIEQFVFTSQGTTTDFHYATINKYATILDWKTNPEDVEQIILQNPKAPIITWMYSSILLGHKLKFRLKTENPIFWNIRHSSFRWNQIYQKLALFAFSFYSHLKQPKIIYCSYRAKEVHEMYFFSKKNSVVIQNRLAKKQNLNPSEVDVIDEKSYPFLLYVGRYEPIKGPRRLVQITRTFFSENPGINLKIAGSGWTIDKIPNQIRERILLLGNVKNIYPLYRSTKALLFTSHAEGYPNVLVEAVVSGAPIVGFEAGDSKLILDNYKFGYSVNTRSEFIDKLGIVLDNPISNEEKEKEIVRQQKLLDFRITAQEYLRFLE